MTYTFVRRPDSGLPCPPTGPQGYRLPAPRADAQTIKSLHHQRKGLAMTTLSSIRFPTSPDGDRPDAGRAPPPPRLPRFLLQHLARPLNNPDDVDELMAHIKLAQSRGLL